MNSKGIMRCIYCRRYIDDDKQEVSEEELLEKQAFDYTKGIRLNIRSSEKESLSSEEFANIAKVIGIIILLLSIFFLILKALF